MYVSQEELQQLEASVQEIFTPFPESYGVRLFYCFLHGSKIESISCLASVSWQVWVLRLSVIRSAKCWWLRGH